MACTMFVVPHCHWDREWYQPRELFCWRLVQVIDELLDHMEGHPDAGNQGFQPCLVFGGGSEGDR